MDDCHYGKLLLYLLFSIFIKVESRPPQLNVLSEWVFDIERNDTDHAITPLSITCSGDKPLTWHTTVKEEYYTVVKSSTVEKYESTLTIKDPYPEDTGYFNCTDSDGQTASTYVYMNDGVYGFVKSANHQAIEAVIGEPIVLDCRTTDPHTKVRVFKDQNQDVTNKFEADRFYRFRKVIESLQDNGIYSCKESRLSSELNWLVSIGTPPIPPKPSIDKHQNAHYVVGVDFSLNCSVQVIENDPRIKWQTPNSHTETHELRSKEDTFVISTLTVKNPSLEDSGNYTCKVTSSGKLSGEETRFINVSAFIEPFVEFIEDDNGKAPPLLVKEHDDFKWVRYFRGYPQDLQYTFYDPFKRELHENEEKVSIDYVFEEGKICLEIKNASAEDFGNYSIKITAPNGQFDKTSAILVVNATPKVEIDNPPPLSSPNEDVHLTANILAFSLESPSPNVKWFMYPSCPDGIGSCDESRREQLEHKLKRANGPLNRHKSTVSIRAKKSAKVEVTVKNNFGEKSAFLHLNVSDKRAPFLMTVWTESGEIDLTNERGTKRELIDVVEGDNITMECSALNFLYDQLRLISRFDNQSFPCDTELSSGRCMKMSLVEEHNIGSYKCTAHNKGTDTDESITFSINVLEKMAPRLKNGSNVSEEGNEITVKAGNPFKIHCLVEGLPKPTIIWLKDGENVENLPEFMERPDRVVLSEDKQTIEFKFAQMEYGGEYLCRVDNRIGTIKPFASVIVEGVGLTSVQLTVIGLAATFIVLLIGIVFFLIFRVKKESKLRNELRQNQLYLFEKGNIGDLSTECTIDEQADLLPYDKSYEVSKEAIKLGKQLGSGAFGRVMQADVEGLEEEGKVTRVAVKMCKDGADVAHLRALTVELKIMIHLGKHLNIVNLMGAYTSNIIKGDLWILVEYCKYGNLLKFLQKLKSRFVNQIDPVTGVIDIHRISPLPYDPLSPTSLGRGSQGYAKTANFEEGYIEARSPGGSMRSNRTGVGRQQSNSSNSDSHYGSGTTRPGLYVGNPHYTTASILQESSPAPQPERIISTPPPTNSGEHYVMATELPSPPRKESSVSTSPSSEGVYHMTLNTEMTAISSHPPFSPSSVTSEFFFDSQGNPVTFDAGGIPGFSVPFTTTELICWAWQVANGMEYLSRRKVLHGDLAARNLLLAENNVVKISDFGLSRDIYKQDIYMKQGDEIMPIKWMAPEAIQQKIFSIQSDVWAYGITLWEMFTLGNTPYPGIPLNQDFPIALENGMRMEKPKYCNDEIYNLMMDCWRHNPVERPSFAAIADKLSMMLSPESRDNYVAMNTIHMKKNEEWMNSKDDYLNMVTSPDFHNLITPEEEVRGDEAYIAMQSVKGECEPNVGYLDMRLMRSSSTPTPPDNIFSPRPPSSADPKSPGGSVFSFSGDEVPHSEDQQSPAETSNLLDSSKNTLKGETKPTNTLRNNNNNNNISKHGQQEGEQQQPLYQNLEKLALTKSEDATELSPLEDLINDDEQSSNRNYINIPKLHQNYINTSQLV